MEQAIPLIEIRNGQLAIKPEAVALFEAIDNHIAIISICGLPLTGKSSVINWVIDKNDCFPISIANSKKNFDVKVHAWISSELNSTPEGDQYRIVWLDLEGIINSARTTTVPASHNLVSIAVLLSSCLVYNSKGNPDDEAISSMSFFGELTKSLRVSCLEEPERDILSFPKIFPKFVWSVRDVKLDALPNIYRTLNPTQTMEAVLVPSKGFDRPTFERNRIRNILTTFFVERKCVFLVNPEINSFIPRSNLNPDFQLCLSLFEKEVLSDLKIKSVCGTKLNGSTFIKLLGIYIHSINTGELPTVTSAWSEVCVLESHSAVALSMKVYCKLMDEKFSADKLPRDEKELVSADETARGEALVMFRSRFLGESTLHMVDVLVDAMSKQYRVYEDENKKASQQLAEAVLLDLYGAHIRPNLIPDTSQSIKYLSDIQALRNDWRTMTFQLHQNVKGPGKYVVLSEFSRETLLDAIGILTGAIREEFESSANAAVGVTQLTLDELSDALQSSLNDLIASQSALTQSNQKAESYRLSCEDLQLRLKDMTTELELAKSSRVSWEAESSAAIQALEGALQAQTELCVVKDGTINALKSDVALVRSMLQAEMQSSQNYQRDMESAQAALSSLDEVYQKKIAQKDEEIARVMRKVDDKIWEAEKDARQKEMEMSSTSAEIIAFQSKQLSEQVKKFDDLKLKMREDSESYEEELLRREAEITDLKDQLNEMKALRIDDVSKLENQIADVKDSYRQETDKWQAQYASAMQAIDEHETTIKGKIEEISSLKTELTRLTFVEKVLNETIAGNQKQLTQNELEIERLRANLEISGCSSQEQYQMIAELRQDVDSKTMTISQLLVSLEESRFEIDQQRGRLLLLESDSLQRTEVIKDLNSQIESLESAKVEQLLKVLELEKSIQVLTDTERCLQGEIKSLEESLVSREETMRKLEKNIEEQHETITIYAKQIVDGRAANEAAMTVIEQKLAAVTASEKECQGVRDVLLQINQELTEANTTISDENKHLKQTYGGMHENFERAKLEIGGKLKNEEVTKQTLADALYERECQLEMTKRELNTATSQRDELRAKLDVYEADISSKTTIISVMEDRIKELERDNLAVQANFKVLSDDIAALTAEKAKFFDEMEFVISKARSAETKLRTELEHVQAQLQERDSLLTPTNNALQDLTERMAETRVQLETVQARAQALQDELTKVTLERDKLQDETFNHQEKISTLECAAAVLQSEKESAELEMNDIEGRLQAKSDEVDQLLQQMEKLEVERRAWEDEKSRVREDDSVLQRMLEVKSNEKFVLEAEVENLKDSIRRLHDRLEASDGLISEQRDALAERDYTITQLESSVEEITDRARDYKNTIDKQLLKTQELVTSLAAMTQLSESLEVSKKDLSEKLQLLEENFRKSNGELTARIIEQNTAIDRLEGRISELNEIIDDDLITQLKQDVEDKNQEITELTNVYIKLRQRVTDLEEELVGKSHEADRLRVENRENVALLRELTPQLERLKGSQQDELEQLADLEKAKKLNESYKGELIVARERIMELEKAFQDTIEKMMTK